MRRDVAQATAGGVVPNAVHAACVSKGVLYGIGWELCIGPGQLKKVSPKKTYKQFERYLLL